MLAEAVRAQTTPAPPSRADLARRELARRELARRHLIDFCCYVDPGAAWEGATDPFVANRYRARHLRLIADTIEQAVDGRLWRGLPGQGKKILMITCPPGHWKSSLVSRKLPAWYVGRRHAEGRHHAVILTSYNASLATMNNARVLELVQTPLYQNVFPDVQLSRQSQGSEEWSLAAMPYVSCKAAGVGGGLTGYHGSLVIVDDPIKDRREANSPTVRENLWDWWKDVLRTRLFDEQSFILGIWTRWTEDDPMGRIARELKEGNSEERVVMLRLPALAETPAERESGGTMGLPVDREDPLGRRPGEALWPEVESAAEHRATKKAFPVTFDSLYQGRPRPEGGYVAGRAQFKLLPAPPATDVRWILATDWAITEKEAAPKSKQDPDYTVSALVGLWTPGGNREEVRLVVHDMRFGQLNPHDAVRMVKGHMLEVGARVPMRSGQANVDKVFLFRLRSDADLVGFSIKNLTRKELAGDKMTQAQPWFEMVHAGLVWVVEGRWNDWFFNLVESFPHGAHDDGVDVVSVGVHAHGLAGKSRAATSARVPGFGR